MKSETQKKAWIVGFLDTNLYYISKRDAGYVKPLKRRYPQNVGKNIYYLAPIADIVNGTHRLNLHEFYDNAITLEEYVSEKVGQSIEDLQISFDLAKMRNDKLIYNSFLFNVLETLEIKLFRSEIPINKMEDIIIELVANANDYIRGMRIVKTEIVPIVEEIVVAEEPAKPAKKPKKSKKVEEVTL